ncbi:MAG: hypothetical protein HY081_11405 [Gammaproteobacteria bacterium]|nr:hypothetical protein [Gammaproteobacteria bacterium]
MESLVGSTTTLEITSMPPPTGGAMSAMRRFLKEVRLLHQREKRRIREEISQVPGLLALLMKPRNGQKWTKNEYKELRAQLRRLSRLSIYLATVALPGTTLTLPLIAWWLDQRQKKRHNASNNAA